MFAAVMDEALPDDTVPPGKPGHEKFTQTPAILRDPAPTGQTDTKDRSTRPTARRGGIAAQPPPPVQSRGTHDAGHSRRRALTTLAIHDASCSRR